MRGPGNPYIAGRVLGGERGFFGRESILTLVTEEMCHYERNAVVLFGQRRIGKTSILRQLERRLCAPLLPIFFDLMDQAELPLGQVLYNWAARIARKVQILPAPVCEQFDNAGQHFREVFLPQLYQHLPEPKRPILLLDEFDVFEPVPGQEQAPVAARTFFPFFRQLMESEPRLGFVFAVGRRAEDLSRYAKATFKAVSAQRVSLLDPESAEALVRSAEREGSLRFAAGSVERVLALTSGHPYFTQLLCQRLWDQAHRDGADAFPLVGEDEVDAVVPGVLEAGHAVYEWIWGGLPPAERVILAAVAEVAGGRYVVSEDELHRLLERHGRAVAPQVALAPATLVEWEMLRQDGRGYYFPVELLRRWVAIHKPLRLVRDELDRLVPAADQAYQLADYYLVEYHERGDPAKRTQAAERLHEALRLNPSHLKARLALAQVLQDEGSLEAAVQELEIASKSDEETARPHLVRALLLHAEALERTGDLDVALKRYDRIAALSLRDAPMAAERRAALLARAAEQATVLGIPAQAQAAFDRSGDPTHLIQSLRERRATEALERKAETHVERQEWAEAWLAYRTLLAREPTDARIREAAARCELEVIVSERYAESLQAAVQGNWAQEEEALAAVVRLKPGYEDAWARLSRVRSWHSRQLVRMFALATLILLMACLAGMTFALNLTGAPPLQSADTSSSE